MTDSTAPNRDASASGTTTGTASGTTTGTASNATARGAASTAPCSPVPLSAATLDRLPEGVARPAYDRAALTPGIVHFGVGNFHRAHQAVYLDRLLNAGTAHDWAILGVGTRAPDAATQAALAAQDHLYTLVEQTAASAEARVIGAVTGMIGPDRSDDVLAALSAPATRIVSLTVTEGGYYLDGQGAFDPTHPDIRGDAEGVPGTVFGLIAEGLARRREAGLAPFTVMSCDNLPHNGAVARAAVVGTARGRDGALADWIEAEIAFPNGMVDRITPATGARELRLVREVHGVADERPVFCEDFIQWVLEDRFPAGRPPLEEAGVEFVADVTAHEMMKLRVLNAGHAIIAYPAGLLGIEFAHEAMAHPLVAGFLDRVEREEIVPHVPAIPGTDPVAYYERCAERFANPKIADTIRRLCHDGSNRQPKFVVPTLRDRLAAGAEVRGLALESALWCRYCHGEDEAGRPIEANDPAWDALRERARRARSEPAAWLAMDEVYGELGGSPALRDAFAAALETVWAKGTAGALEAYLAG